MGCPFTAERGFELNRGAGLASNAHAAALPPPGGGASVGEKTGRWERQKAVVGTDSAFSDGSDG